MDARTYELLNSPLATVIAEATTEQLRVIRERKNRMWRQKIDEEIARRCESIEAPARQPERWSAEWKSRPGTVARFIEEDEAIHGVN